MEILAAIVVALVVVAAVAHPLVTGRGAPLDDGPDRATEIREVAALRDIALETLRDLEFDRHAGKISESDYSELLDRTRSEAAALMKRLDRLHGDGVTAPEPERRG
jgi:hypothetical protein